MTNVISMCGLDCNGCGAYTATQAQKTLEEIRRTL
jgi:hypothetical protein